MATDIPREDAAKKGETKSGLWTECSFIVGVSEGKGVGVFATHDIPKGTRLFSSEFELRRLRAEDVPLPFRKFCIAVNDTECVAPARFDRLDVGWYVNHSDIPNIQQCDTKHCVALRDIKQNEEILADYNHRVPGLTPYKPVSVVTFSAPTSDPKTRQARSHSDCK